MIVTCINYIVRYIRLIGIPLIETGGLIHCGKLMKKYTCIL